MSTALIDQLQAIRDEHGTLTPELVADVAAAPEHPLHSRVYDCAPEEASRRYYVERARKLLQVTFRPDPSKPRDLRAFVAVKGEETPTSEYVPTTEALSDPFTRELLLRQMKCEAQTFQRRWKDMAEYADMLRGLLGEESA